ncbi:MAG: FAD/NAD(P)-binding protein [archaeon GB-1867-005]|nr:FAD/NAD(P)-binding protein [Candidatus Culexmicrobium cathedralense]
MQKARARSLYTPRPARIAEIIDEAPGIKTFKLEFTDNLHEKFEYTPGQFIQLSVYGFGEAPFAISSPTSLTEAIEVTVKAVGRVTRALFNLDVGSPVGVRGPYGNGFPIKLLEGRNVILVGGGTGLSPLRPLIWHLCSNRSKFERVVLLYGARSPKDLLFRREYGEWDKSIEIHLTVDFADEAWGGSVGVVTDLIDIVKIPVKNAIAIVCGPPIMMKFTALKLMKLGFKKHQIYVSLERQMKCGVGKCGHCMLSNGKYVCIDGPVFRLDEIPFKEVES